ncbi:MAG: hypothetical protein IPO09_02210 [Anaeromyxobacter sp.]|nr:hypothetical protein [Anaeromyxobacter sp.]
MLTDLMSRYLLGEKLESLVFIVPLGLLSALFGAWLLTERFGPFARGAAWPFLVIGLLLAGTGAVVGFRTPAQVERLTAGFAAAPEATRAAELARMEKVNGAWSVYVAVWATFAVAGLALRFALRSPLAHGAGAALLFFAGVGLLVDGFAEHRARGYTEALEAERAERSAPPGG